MRKDLQFLIYSTPQEDIKVNVVVRDETIWLTQKAMATLFDTSPDNISLHLKNIYSDRELTEDTTAEDFSVVQKEGNRDVRRNMRFYNLDAIISVGYRVNSAKATQFRIWATQTLREFLQKGFVLDDERLKQGEQVFGKDYFQELLERVRSIRASERRVYQKITDIFAECSIDYDPKSETTQLFYAQVQDKFHFAITGQTASEKIYTTADSTKPRMGMMTYKNAPNGRVLKSDTTIGKNYLTEDEIRRLERAVSSFFDYIEGIIERRMAFDMQGFAASVNKFLEFNEYKVLEGYGKITRKQADEKALSEYEKFNRQQKIESDFDKAVNALEHKGKHP